MPVVTPSGETLGARITGIDLSRPLSQEAFALILRALAAHGVLCFPDQRLDPAAQVAFRPAVRLAGSACVGAFQLPDHPEVMILSNIVQDANRSASPMRAGLAHRHVVQPHHRLRQCAACAACAAAHGRVLGDTLFADMAAAYDDLPEASQARLETLTATHDFAKFWT